MFTLGAERAPAMHCTMQLELFYTKSVSLCVHCAERQTLLYLHLHTAHMKSFHGPQYSSPQAGITVQLRGGASTYLLTVLQQNSRGRERWPTSP